MAHLNFEWLEFIKKANIVTIFLTSVKIINSELIDLKD